MLVESNTLLITVKKFLPKSIGSVPKIGEKDHYGTSVEGTDNYKAKVIPVWLGCLLARVRMRVRGRGL